MGLAKKIFFFLILIKGVLCSDFSISLPETIEALDGSCVLIKCTFSIQAIYGNLTKSAIGIWYQGGKKVFDSSSPNTNDFKGEITKKLQEKNCTTIFYDVSSKFNGEFKFRIQDIHVKYTYSAPVTTINVIESPPNPIVKLYVEQMEVEGQEQVLENSSVSLRCSAKTLCSSPPPALTWSSTLRHPLSESSRIQEPNPTEIISDLNFTATHLHHIVTFICTITYQLQDSNKTAYNSITLHVQYAPKNTSVSVFPSHSVLLEGDSVTLTCSSDANPAVFSYTWYREDGGQMEQLQTGDILTFNKINLTHRGWYHCRAQNQHGTQNTSMLLDIQFAPRISISSSCYTGDAPVCFCEVDGNPSPKLEWHLSGRPVTDSTTISEEQLSSIRLRSSITLHHSLTDTPTLQCVSTNTHGTDAQEFQLFLFSKNTTWFNSYSLLLGAAVGASVLAIFCITTHLCNKLICSAGREEKTGGVLPDGENKGESVYGNTVMLSTAGAVTLNPPESLHYSSIHFKNTKPKSEEIRGVSSLTGEYDVVRFYSQGGQAIPDSQAKVKEVSSLPQRDSKYITHCQVAHRAGTEAHLVMSANLVEKQVESKENRWIDKASDLYAQIKPHGLMRPQKLAQ